MVVIEHNLDVIKCADYIIDLGRKVAGGVNYCSVQWKMCREKNQ